MSKQIKFFIISLSALCAFALLFTLESVKPMQAAADFWDDLNPVSQISNLIDGKPIKLPGSDLLPTGPLGIPVIPNPIDLASGKLPLQPIVRTDDADMSGALKDIILKGYVNPQGAVDTISYVEWGQNPDQFSYRTGDKSTPIPMEVEFNVGSAHSRINFTPGVYYFRIMAKNALFKEHGQTLSFTVTANMITPPVIVPVTPPVNPPPSTNTECADGKTMTLAEAKTARANQKINLGQITAHSDFNTITGLVENSTGCNLPLSLAVFTINDPSDPDFNLQTLFDSTHSIIIPPHFKYVLLVKMPRCNFQADYFYGDNYPNPTGDRRVHSDFFMDGAYLVNRESDGGFSCQPPPPVVTTGHLQVIKRVINDDGGTLQPSDFSLVIDRSNVHSGDTLEVGAGVHTVREVQMSGYNFEGYGGDCAADGTVTINPGDNKVCTLTNNDIKPIPPIQPSYIRVLKTVINDDGGTLQPSDFNLFIDSTGVHSGDTLKVEPGVHTVKETQVTGYNFDGFSGDCAADGTVTVNAGETKVCTLTNNDVKSAPPIQPAYIRVLKTVINDNGGTKQSTDFTLKIDGRVVTMGSFVHVPVGRHMISEDQLSGYTLQSISGDCASDGSITISAGQDKTCTLVNNDIAPPPVTPNLTATCIPDQQSITAPATITWKALPQGGTGTYSYNWSGADNLSGSAQNQAWTYNLSGSKNAHVIVQSGNQTVTADCNAIVNAPVIPPPVTPALDLRCVASATQVPTGSTITWTALPSGGTGSYNYSWSGSDNLTGSTASVSQKYTTAGDKSATITVSSGSQTLSRTCTTTITAPPPVVAGLSAFCSATPSTVQVGYTTTWQATATGGNGTYTYSWSGDDNLSGTAATIAHTYYVAGRYNGQVIITSGGQNATAQCGVNAYVPSGGGANQPTVTLSRDIPNSPLAASYIYLSQVPYTGLGDRGMGWGWLLGTWTLLGSIGALAWKKFLWNKLPLKMMAFSIVSALSPVGSSGLGNSEEMRVENNNKQIKTDRAIKNRQQAEVKKIADKQTLINSVTELLLRNHMAIAPDALDAVIAISEGHIQVANQLVLEGISFSQRAKSETLEKKDIIAAMRSRMQSM